LWSGCSRGRGVVSKAGTCSNLALVDALRTVAQAKGVTVTQAAIAWVAPRPPISCRLVGARRRDRLTEALGAAELTLSQRERNYRFIAASSGMAAPRRARSVSAGAKRRVQQQRSLPVVVRLSYHIPSGDGPATGVAGAMILSIAARSASLSETSAAARLSLTWFGCRAPTMATCTAGLASVQAMAN